MFLIVNKSKNKNKTKHGFFLSVANNPEPKMYIYFIFNRRLSFPKIA